MYLANKSKEEVREDLYWDYQVPWLAVKIRNSNSEYPRFEIKRLAVQQGKFQFWEKPVSFPYLEESQIHQLLLDQFPILYEEFKELRCHGTMAIKKKRSKQPIFELSEIQAAVNIEFTLLEYNFNQFYSICIESHSLTDLEKAYTWLLDQGLNESLENTSFADLLISL
ncbi:MAG: hypothetical protein INQ03_25375 [Candidatus Heimdallarchaeota archaeon]|nr:hypothetical protein [Candidatus Heimdallarchaeota archaeon]